jgi:hypothetical protein
LQFYELKDRYEDDGEEESRKDEEVKEMIVGSRGRCTAVLLVNGMECLMSLQVTALGS